MVKEEVAVLIVLVRRHRRAAGAAVRRAVDVEVPGAVKEETGPAAVPCAPCAPQKDLLALLLDGPYGRKKIPRFDF